MSRKRSPKRMYPKPKGFFDYLIGSKPIGSSEQLDLRRRPARLSSYEVSVEWYGSEHRLPFRGTVVIRRRIHLEAVPVSGSICEREDDLDGEDSLGTGIGSQLFASGSSKHGLTAAPAS
jgi:hypothetical protein